jgi:glucose-6-phosphate isomerase
VKVKGKNEKGIFPVNAAYSTDLHSIGQMIQQGKRNLIESILVVEENITRFEVRESPSGSDELDYLTGRLFHEINRKALDGTIEAHTAGGVPVIRIQIQKLNAHNLGELIYFYELFTAVYVYMLQVNPFNQPGVEDYKKAMYRNLGKK